MKLCNKQSVFMVIALFSSLLTAACAFAGGGGQSAEPVVLVYANLTENGVSREAVARFNAAHRGKVRIEVRDYFDANGVSGEQRLLTEMAAGKIPDILDMRGMPYQVLSRRGYLEDLWPYIENDPELGREGVVEPPLKAAEVDGGLYVVFGEVYINTLIGAENVVGNRYSWSLAELQEAFSSMPEESTILEYFYTKDTMFYYVFRMALESYVNWETGQCSFDGEQFRSSLEFVNSFPESFDFWDEEAVNTEWVYRIMTGRQMLSQQAFGRLADLQSLDAIFGQGGRAAFIGYPTEDGSAGSSFYLPARERKLAMSAVCQDKEAAWEFLRQSLLPRYDNLNDDALSKKGLRTLPVNRKDYERIIRFDMAPKNSARGKYGLRLYNGPMIPLRAATEEELARYEDFIGHIDKIEFFDSTIYSIVKETCGPYFAGDKTLDETVALVQNRVSLYVNESR